GCSPNRTRLPSTPVAFGTSLAPALMLSPRELNPIPVFLMWRSAITHEDVAAIVFPKFLQVAPADFTPVLNELNKAAEPASTGDISVSALPAPAPFFVIPMALKKLAVPITELTC